MTEIREAVASEAEGLAILRTGLATSGVLDAVPVLRLGYERPTWLAALADVYERAFRAARGEGPPVRALVSAPSQVGKTTLGQTAIAWWLNRCPTDHLAFLSYGQDIANIKSAEVRDHARDIGLELRGDTTAKDLWRTAAGGSVLARGLGGGITGMSGLSLIIVDDPYRNRLEAESAAHRRRIHGDVRAVVFSRVHPRTSLVIALARWSPNDLIGELESELGDRFESHRIPAVDDEGEPVVTMGGRTKEWWAEQRRLMGEHDWWSLMQGRPRPREGRLFVGVTTYQHPPSEGQTVIGIDLAYTTRASADYSTIVVLTRTDQRVYVREVHRSQESSPDFFTRLRGVWQRYGCAPIRCYIGGTERGIIDVFARDGVPIIASPASMDKVSRAQGTAGQWAAGNILLPEAAPWLDGFVSEVLDFGPGSAHDDQVDALVAAHDGLAVHNYSAGDFTAQVRSPSMLGAPRYHGKRGPW